MKKKVISLLLVFAMVFAFTVPVLAAEDVYKRQLHNGGNSDAATPREGRRFSDCKPLSLVKKEDGSQGGSHG